MIRKRKRKAPEIVMREGEPTAVILDIDEYQEMLERLEDMEDLKIPNLQVAVRSLDQKMIGAPDWRLSRYL